MLVLLVGEFALAWHSEVQANPVMQRRTSS